MKRHLAQALADAEALLQAWRADPSTLEELEAIAEAFAECLQAGHKILVAGNGGSLADAVHFAEEWTGRFRENRRPYPVMALAEPAHLTCVGNDFGFEDVFARPVQAFGRPGDVLLLLSTSGQSPNLVKAAVAARQQGMRVVALLGRGGGSLKTLCDLAHIVPGNTADRIQELHMLALHALIEAVETRLEP